MARPLPLGDLTVDAFSLGNVTVREYGGAAVAVGVVTQRVAHRGQDASGRFGVTQVAVQHGGGWRIAGVQFSGPVPDAPPRQ